jgi:hypothetical protein
MFLGRAFSADMGWARRWRFGRRGVNSQASALRVGMRFQGEGFRGCGLVDVVLKWEYLLGGGMNSQAGRLRHLGGGFGNWQFP